MKKIVILGSGAGGTMCAAKLRRKLGRNWKITIIDNDEMHHYQPGWLFIPFGIYTPDDCMKPKRDFMPPGVDVILDDVEGVNPNKREVECKKSKYSYDYLIVGTGCLPVPEEVEGLEDWKADPESNEHTFFTLESAVALYKRMKHFEKGKMIFNIAEMPHKCPVVPMEFIFMADWFFAKNGYRDNIEIEFVTPNTGLFTKPIATKVMTASAEEKEIKVVPSFDLEVVNKEEKYIESARGDKLDYDLFISTMPNLGADYIENSGMGDGMGYVLTDDHTLKAEKYDNIYVVGDATNVPTSKAGSVAHYEADIIVENLLLEIDGKEPKPSFDGHSTCFIVSGYEKAFLFDFNYKTEPLPGKFPFPGIGPFDLVGESNMNYWGKMMFKWVYWNLLLSGQDMPLEPQMEMAGKHWPKVSTEE
ncbi:MAG: NAD(P)/FAD-dependent oxidoreductase [Deltaproteobacteria bacterium]|nr:MAG: NAD(P)/FAD-dependent oxidoreductase [Deltaproteobacteria bacterium]